MKSTVSSKGQITIPVEIRRLLGLKAGTPVVFEPHPRGALLHKGVAGRHPVDRIFGSLALEGTVDEALDELRGPRSARPLRRERPSPKERRR
jgi:AbrB family looped-hinge helix DNA binding protein